MARRKMTLEELRRLRQDKKRPQNRIGNDWKLLGLRIALHAIFWLAIIVAALSLGLFGSAFRDTNILPSAILMSVSVCFPTPVRWLYRTNSNSQYSR